MGDAAALPRPGRRRALRWLLPLAVVAAFVVAVGGRWSDVARELGGVGPGAVLGALLLCVVAVHATFLSWREILADLGSRMAMPAAAKVFYVGQLGKYLPGSVWPVLVQMRMGREMGVARSRLAAAFVVTLGLSVALGLLVGLSAVPALLSGQRGHGALWLLAALPPMAVFLHPRPINVLLDLGLRLARRPPLEYAIGPRGVLRGSAGILVFWVLGGLHVWLLAVDRGADPLRALPVAIGGFALAFCAGPLLVVLPAGAGVREAVLVVLLSGVLSTGAAVAVALLSRLLLAAVDGMLALGAVLAARGGAGPRTRGA